MQRKLYELRWRIMKFVQHKMNNLPQYWGLNLGLCTGVESALPLSHIHSPSPLF